MEKVKIISNEAGVCPYCNSEDIDYDVAKFEPNFIYYPCTCNKCKRYFEEWNELNFSGHNVGSSGEIEASDCLNKEIDYDGEYINDAGNDDKDIDWDNFDDLCEDYEDEYYNNYEDIPYGLDEAKKVLDGTAPDYYYHLKEIEMDSEDGAKLANYAKELGLDVKQDMGDDTYCIPGEYHWSDCYFYPYPIEDLYESVNSIKLKVGDTFTTNKREILEQKQPLQFKHIKDCWNALNKAESVNEVRELLKIFPRWSGDWWIDCKDGNVVVCNSWYDRTCETWELDRETLYVSYNED